jgi:hypothetical protein
MLGGGGDGLVDHLPLRWAEQLVTEVLKQPGGGRGVGQATPALAGAVQYRPDQLQAGALAGEPADHLGAAAGLPKGPLQQVGVADALPVLAREPQVDRQLLQGGGEAGDRGRVAGRIAGGERLGAAGGLIDRGLPGRLVDVVEDLPVGGP